MLAAGSGISYPVPLRQLTGDTASKTTRRGRATAGCGYSRVRLYQIAADCHLALIKDRGLIISALLTAEKWVRCIALVKAREGNAPLLEQPDFAAFWEEIRSCHTWRSRFSAQPVRSGSEAADEVPSHIPRPMVGRRMDPLRGGKAAVVVASVLTTSA